MRYFMILIMSLLLLCGCNRSGSSETTATEPQVVEETAIAVDTETAARDAISRYTELSGTVIAKHSMEIMAENTGKITGLTVEYGDSVTKDQVIAMIDPSRPGMKYGMTELKAPMSGTITALNISEGGYTSSSMSSGTVTDLTDLRVSINIPEQYVTRVKSGDKVTMILDAYPGETFTGTVSFLSPTLDSSSKTRKAEILVDGERELIVGMYARVSLLTASSDDTVLVPTEAIITESGSSYVYTVTGDRVSRVQVTTGLYDSTRTEVLSGLEGGETVVTRGQQQLSDGAKVSV